MGANEYTPDTEQVREQYTREQPPHIGTVSQKRSELDRWLEQIKREAKAEALEEAAAELAQESDAASHTARKFSGDDNTRYHAYSSAYSVAAYKLENRAAQLKEQP